MLNPVLKLNVFKHYEKVGLQNFDALNSFIIDSRGYVRWLSTSSDFSVVDSSNAEIKTFFEAKGLRSLSKSGCLCLPSEKRKSLELGFMLTFNHDTIDAFGSKERLGHEIMAYLQNKLDITFELRKVSDEPIGKNISEFTFKFNTGFDRILVDQELMKCLKQEIQDCIKQYINKTPAFL